MQEIPDTRDKARTLNITKTPFSPEYPLTPLHWIISDRNESIVLESTKDGLHIYDNPCGVMTNNPPFPYHLRNLEYYRNLTNDDPDDLEIKAEFYSRGMGAVGLPGDYSSASRFVKAVFVKENSVTSSDEPDSVSQFFHILDAVSMPRGCVKANGEYEITAYSCCCNTDNGVYYYTTYENRQITAVDMHHVNIDQEKMISFPLIKQQKIYNQTIN